MKCRICSKPLVVLGTIPFERNSKEIPYEFPDKEATYHICTSCRNITCQEMLDWSQEDFSKYIYNDKYIQYDPDYAHNRPNSYANSISEAYSRKKIKHLDYGSGSGVMSKILKDKFLWDSTAYDPFSNPVHISRKFNFITAIEVFEHSADIDKTIVDIQKYLDKDGVILFSTLLVPSDVTIDWWYIGAVQGHINIQSRESMTILAKRNGMLFSTLVPNVHILQNARGADRQLRKK